MRTDGIYLAVKHGNLKELKKRLAKGANPNETDFMHGITMLQLAIIEKQPLVIKELVLAGANVNETYRYPQLHPMKNEAVRAAVDELAATGAKETTSTSNPKTLRERVFDSMKLKESQHQVPNPPNRDIISLVRSNKLKKLRKLLASGANPNKEEHYRGQSALQIAINECKPEIAIELLVYGAEAKNYLKDNALVKEIQNIMVDINQAVGIEKNELSQDQKVDEIQTKMSAFIDVTNKDKLNTASIRSLV